MTNQELWDKILEVTRDSYITDKIMGAIANHTVDTNKMVADKPTITCASPEYCTYRKLAPLGYECGFSAEDACYFQRPSRVVNSTIEQAREKLKGIDTVKEVKK